MQYPDPGPTSQPDLIMLARAATRGNQAILSSLLKTRMMWPDLATVGGETLKLSRNSKGLTGLEWPGAGIMEADDRQVTTVSTVQPSFHHRHSTNRVP